MTALEGAGGMGFGGGLVKAPFYVPKSATVPARRRKGRGDRKARRKTWGGDDMRRKVALFLGLAWLGTGLGATEQRPAAAPLKASRLETDQAADRAAITAVLQAQQAAWNRGDVIAFLEGYWKSPELTFSGSGGVARGFDGVLARYKKNYPDRAAMGDLQFSGLEFRFLGPDAALVLGKWHLKRETGDIGGVFSLVWEKFPEGWKIIHDHTSAVEEPKQ
jgi:uncharacterized protein (TIGR02246 family)